MLPFSVYYYIQPLLVCFQPEPTLVYWLLLLPRFSQKQKSINGTFCITNKCKMDEKFIPSMEYPLLFSSYKNIVAAVCTPVAAFNLAADLCLFLCWEQW